VALEGMWPTLLGRNLGTGVEGSRWKVRVLDIVN